MNARATALVDQARAANAHGWQAFNLAAQIQQAPPRAVAMYGPRAAIVRRLVDHAVSGRLRLCGHLSPRAPQPQLWCAWTPDRLYCGQCCDLANLTVRGTDEDRRCDHCQTIVPTIIACQAWLPGAVAPALGVASGPTQLIFGLCPPCMAASENPLSGPLPAEQDAPRGTGRVQPRGSRGRGRGRRAQG